jgi:hypothetical protein
MAQLIIVHRDHNNEELVLNADRIVWAEHIAATRKSYTMVALTNGKSLAIHETLDDLTRLCDKNQTLAPARQTPQPALTRLKP